MPRRREEELRNNPFILYGQYGPTLSQAPQPWRSWNLQFCRTLLGHHFYVLSLSVLGPGVEKKIFKEIMHLYYMANVATPYHKNLWNWQFYENVPWSSSLHFFYIVICFIPRSREEDFIKAPGGWGPWNFTIYIPFILLMLYAKFTEDWSSSTWDDSVVNARHTLHKTCRTTNADRLPCNKSPE